VTLCVRQSNQHRPYCRVGLQGYSGEAPTHSHSREALSRAQITPLGKDLKLPPEWTVGTGGAAAAGGTARVYGKARGDGQQSAEAEARQVRAAQRRARRRVTALGQYERHTLYVS
jgi:hypothetical protein